MAVLKASWTAEEDAKLLANILHIHAIKLDYEALGKAMGRTPKSLMHRVAKIKEIADGKKHTTPKKSLKSSTATTRATGGLKRGANGAGKGEASTEEGDDDEDLDLTPGKKVKVEDRKIKMDDEDS